MQSLKCMLEEEGFRPFWSWLCERCGSPLGFYSVVPAKCLICHTPVLFNPKALIERVEERVKYHVQNVHTQF